MGKEIKGIEQKLPKKITPPCHLINAKQEIDTQWDPSKNLTNPTISYNGEVIVTIIKDNSARVIYCNGISRKENNYIKFVKLLRKRGYIPMGEGIKKMLLDKGFMSIIVNMRKDKFNPGDKIIIVMNNTRTIRKRLRKSNK